MNYLSDIITYVRRIIKSPSDAVISDNLIIDYINRFWINDLDAIMQVFDLKTKYLFQTTPGVVDYNMPLYSIQTEPGPQDISYYPIYQGFFDPCFINGIQGSFSTQREVFYNMYPLYVQPLQQVATGDGTTTNFSFQLPFFPAIPGHVDMMGMLSAGRTKSPIFTNDLLSINITSVQPRVYISYTEANGSNVIVHDSGQFLASATDSDLYGFLISPLPAPGPGLPLNGGYSMTSNTVNYNTGAVNVSFFNAPPAGTPIQVQCYFYEEGIPRSILFYNNTLTVIPPPNTQYLVELGAYLSPAAFISSGQYVPFAYMSEFLSRGAARKILSDTGDMEQLQFYEPFYQEQKMLVWKRSQRQFTSTRTPTIFSQNQGIGANNNMGTGTQ